MFLIFSRGFTEDTVDLLETICHKMASLSLLLSPSSSLSLLFMFPPSVLYLPLSSLSFSLSLPLLCALYILSPSLSYSSPNSFCSVVSFITLQTHTTSSSPTPLQHYFNYTQPLHSSPRTLWFSFFNLHVLSTLSSHHGVRQLHYQQHFIVFFLITSTRGQSKKLLRAVWPGAVWREEVAVVV